MMVGDLREGRVPRWQIQQTVDRMKRALDLKHDSEIGYIVQSMGYADQADVEEVMRPLAEDLAAWFIRGTKEQESPSFYIREMDRVTSYAGKVWPEITAAVEECKPEIVRMLLVNIRANAYDQVKKLIKDLKWLGVDWPEFKTMLGSLMEDDGADEKARLRAEGRKMIIDMMRKKAADGTRGIYYAMYHMDEWGFKLKDWPEIREMIDARRKDIMVDILRGLKHNGKDGMSSARFTLERMRRIGVDWLDLDALEKSLGSPTTIGEARFDAEERTIAKEYVEELPEIADSPNDCMYVFQFAHGHEVLFGPSLKQFFEPHREIWVRFLLENLKEGFHFNIDELEDAVRILRRIGIRWPELDVIEKSFKADKKIGEGKGTTDNTESRQLAMVRKDPYAIADMPDASERVQIEAVNYNGYVIRYIQDPSEAVQLAAVARNGAAIADIRNPSESVKMAAVNDDPHALGYIRRPSKAIRDAALANHPYAIRFIRNPSPEMQMSAVSRDPDVIVYIPRPTLEAQILVMRRRPAGHIMGIKHIDPGLWNDKKVKDKVLKMMLRNMRDGDDNSAVSTLKHLRRNSCPWLELVTIEKSMRANKTIREDDEHDGEENEYGRDWRRQVEFKEYLRVLYEDLQAKNWDMIPLDLQELGILDIEYVLPARAKAMIEDNKHEIMVEMLKQLKTSRHPRNMTFATLALSNIGINWPELVIIDKSLAADEDELAKRRADIEESEHGGINEAWWPFGKRSRISDEQVEDYMKEWHEDPVSAVYSMWSNLDAVTDNPRLKSFVDDNKRDVIEVLLRRIRNGDEQEDMARSLLNRLRDVEIDWPELDTIEKSFKADGRLGENHE